MVFTKYTTKQKSDDINVLVNAIKEISIQNKAIRTVSRSYNIDKSKLSRYIKKVGESGIDVSTATDESLTQFFTELIADRYTAGKTVSIFFHLICSFQSFFFHL